MSQGQIRFMLRPNPPKICRGRKSRIATGSLDCKPPGPEYSFCHLVEQGRPMAPQTLSYAEDVRLNYDPEPPAPRFTAGVVRPEGATASGLPPPVPWPSTHTPKPQPLSPAPA